MIEMKRICLAMMLIASAFVTASAAGELSVNNSNVKRNWAVSEEVKEYAHEDFVPGIDATIDMPVGNSKLAVAVKKWIGKTLGVEGKLYDSAEELVDALAAHLQANDPDQTQEFSISKVYENSKLVTFVISGYDYPCGAAHGMPYNFGATFRKSDGKEMGKSLVRKNAKLNSLLKAGLKKYFEVNSDAELRECISEPLKSLSLPGSEPWVEKKGVVFMYGAYEIAPYAAGMPYAVIPISKILPYLTTEGKALLK